MAGIMIWSKVACITADFNQFLVNHHGKFYPSAWIRAPDRGIRRKSYLYRALFVQLKLESCDVPLSGLSCACGRL
jgi:hypothetical protein